VQQPRLCDARPVYQRQGASKLLEPGSGGLAGVATASLADEVFLFFRAHEGEWWLGPVVGGTECYAKATGSRLRVVPEAAELVWRSPGRGDESVRSDAELPGAAPTGAVPLSGGRGDGLAGTSVAGPTSPLLPEEGVGLDVLRAVADARDEPAAQWWCLVLTLVLFACGARYALLNAEISGGSLEKPVGGWSLWRSGSSGDSRRSSHLACVVCLEAPRDILLLPCRHVCCCKACADRLERCPMCRAQKTAVTKVFL